MADNGTIVAVALAAAVLIVGISLALYIAGARQVAIAVPQARVVAARI